MAKKKVADLLLEVLAEAGVRQIDVPLERKRISQDGWRSVPEAAAPGTCI